MNLHFKPITKENREIALALAVGDDQLSNIETTRECLKEADELNLWRPVGIYHGSTMVGFAMYGIFGAEGTSGRVWLDRFLIDNKHQGKGYGRAALKGLIKLLRAEFGKDKIFLSVNDVTIPAVKLYASYGFVFNGESDLNGEKIMVLSF